MAVERAPGVPRGRPPSTSRESVERTALALFAERGFERTTVEEIAAELGVGRRTVFRYFPSKNDIVWGEFDRVLDRLRDELDGHGEDVDVMDALAAAAVASNSYPTEQLPELRTRMTLITTVPALQAHSALRYADWRRVVADYVARRRGERPGDLVPQTVAFAALGASMAAFSVWVAEGGDLEQRLREAYAALGSGFRG
ncbi:MAG TPA: mycofactocin system transcriptional regulator [Solirubrobacteraceae bacterium]|nr:mycofactocin system transcriptional regulator [Solirubrobacteraceae bacterium]